MHSQGGTVREKIRGGDWSEGTQKEVHDLVEQFAADFGYDLDEEGQPLDDSAAPSLQTRDAAESAADGEAGAAEEDAAGVREETTAAA